MILPAPGVAREIAHGEKNVAPHRTDAEIEKRRDIDIGHWRVRIDSAQEQELVDVLIAEARHVRLIEQGDVRRPAITREAPLRLARVPVFRKRIGAQAIGDLVFALARNQIDDAQVETDGVPSRGVDNGACLKRGPCPCVTGTIRVPLTLHPQVSVKRPRADAVQNVFADRPGALCRLTREIGGGRVGDAQLETRDNVAREDFVEAPRGAMRRIALRHAASPCVR